MSALPKNKLFSAGLVSLMLALGACGDDDSSDDGQAQDDAGGSKADAGRDGGLDASSDASGDASARDGATDASKPADASADATVADSGTSSETIPTLNGCPQAEYQDLSGTSAVEIKFGGAQIGLHYSPKCAIVQAGQTVRFSGTFSQHPLAKGTADDDNAGPANSPITGTTNTGTTKEFIFTAAGTYPYRCTAHDGAGMVGAIHVK
jgi:plastocyanin